MAVLFRNEESAMREKLVAHDIVSTFGRTTATAMATDRPKRSASNRLLRTGRKTQWHCETLWIASSRSYFNEGNTVEQLVLDTLTDQDNQCCVAEPPADYLDSHLTLQISHLKWRFVPAEELPRQHSDVLVESMVRDAQVVTFDREWFILHHRVMRKTTDDQIAIAMVGETRLKFPSLRAVSMDNGF
jgi:hypothetical protein